MCSFFCRCFFLSLHVLNDKHNKINYLVDFIMKKSLFLIIIVLTTFSSCVNRRLISYVNDIDEMPNEQLNQNFDSDYRIRIAKGDVLTITVTALDPEAVTNFNLPVVSQFTPGALSVNAIPTLQFYVVDPEGYIQFPVIGKIQLENLTINESRELIASKISRYVKEPVVKVNFINYQITVLGEVNRPGRYAFNTHRITILDALGMAGDLTIYGRRRNVLVIRENQGKLEHGRVDLTSSSLFHSPYFFLRQNDVLYVEPTRERAIATQNVNLYISILSSIVTVTAVVFSFINR